MHAIRIEHIRRSWVLALGAVSCAVLVSTSSGAAGAGTAPSSGAASPPRKPAPAATPVDQHGYPRTYHLYGGGPVEEMARYDMVVGSTSIDAAALRLRNPAGIFLLQPTMNGGHVHVTAPGGASDWAGANDSLKGGTPLGAIRAVNPASDFLHNADGSVVGDGGILGWNLAAPASAGVPQEVAKIFAYAAKLNGFYNCTVRIGKPGKRKRVPCWNGVHSDNWIYGAIGASWFYGPSLDADRDGRIDDDSILTRNWSNGLTRVGTLLRAYLPGAIIGGNGSWYRPDLYAGSDPKGWLKASNYTLIEHMQNYAPETVLAAEKTWLSFKDPKGQPRYMAVLQDATDVDGKTLRWTQTDPNTTESMTRPDVLRSMRWGLTLSLMSGVYYELIGDFYGNPINSRWWFDEFDGGQGVRRRGYLGQPLGAYKKLRAGVYRRDFQHGIAINNSSDETQTVNLGGTFKRLKGTQAPTLNDGATVRAVTIPARDGIVLLKPTAK